MTKAYKIVEVVDGNIKTLFHGINGSRTMPKDVWIKANEVMGKDGTSKTSYLTGWHILYDYREAVQYLKRFTKRLDLLKIVECNIKGTVRPKEHSPSPVFLAEYIRF